MKHPLMIIALTVVFCLFPPAARAKGAPNIRGRILLQVQAHGEAWYVYPRDGRAHYLGRPADAFRIMTGLALGAAHDFIANTDVFPARLSGMILLDVEHHGEAYYIYPQDRKKYYLGGPEDAFNIMRRLGLGITDTNLAVIPKETVQPAPPKESQDPAIFIENVPFAAQAPLGDWSDMREQEGCEETSALMAVRWARRQPLSAQEALNEITGISDWLLSAHGEYRDTSIQDTADWIIKDDLKYPLVNVRRNIRMDDIVNELRNGRLVITALNGQILNNPNYRAPGPPRHMLVIRGYDPATDEFITNDPGTRYGEQYRYNAPLLYEAIRDYPTGYRENISQISKNIIVIYR